MDVSFIATLLMDEHTLMVAVINRLSELLASHWPNPRSLLLAGSPVHPST